VFKVLCHQNSVIFIERGRILRNFVYIAFKQITGNFTYRVVSLADFSVEVNTEKETKI
jgi:hypothetical protein